MADLSPAQTVLALRLCEAVSAYILADGSETDESMAEASDALEKSLDEKDLPIAVPGDMVQAMDAKMEANFAAGDITRLVEAFELASLTCSHLANNANVDELQKKRKSAISAILSAFSTLQRERETNGAQAPARRAEQKELL